MWHGKKRGPTAVGIWMIPASGPEQGNLSFSTRSLPISLEFKGETPDSVKSKAVPYWRLIRAGQAQ